MEKKEHEERKEGGVHNEELVRTTCMGNGGNRFFR